MKLLKNFTRNINVLFEQKSNGNKGNKYNSSNGFDRVATVKKSIPCQSCIDRGNTFTWKPSRFKAFKFHK